MSLFNALPGACAQGLIWGIMAIGVYITYKILDLADLTVDGTMATGGAVCIMMIRSGHSIGLSLLCAVLALSLIHISSINFDKRFFAQDIEGSIAHAAMLKEQGILTEEEKEAITEGLTGIRRDVEEGRLVITEEYEDIHSLSLIHI